MRRPLLHSPGLGLGAAAFETDQAPAIAGVTS